MTIQFLFDLDGTISDPIEGIANSINHALKHFGHEPKPESQLGKYIGPPLYESFTELAETDDEETLKKYIAIYGERYRSVGYTENKVYTDIPRILEALHKNGITMGICTTKKPESADRILKMFDLRQYFKIISGGGHNVQKWQQIEQLMTDKAIDANTIMIGDRSMDMIAASKNNIRSAVVRWGYGSQSEIDEHSPTFIIDTPDELLNLPIE